MVICEGLANSLEVPLKQQQTLSTFPLKLPLPYWYLAVFQNAVGIIFSGTNFANTILYDVRMKQHNDEDEEQDGDQDDDQDDHQDDDHDDDHDDDQDDDQDDIQVKIDPNKDSVHWNFNVTSQRSAWLTA